MSFSHDKGRAVLFSSESTLWGTPLEFFDKLDAEFVFELDAAAVAGNALCPDFIGPQGDSLSTEWSRPGMERRTVWLNPPWGRGLGRWVARAWEQAQAHSLTVVCLVPATTDVAWWHEIAMLHAHEIRLVRGRLHFVRLDGHTGPCPKGAAVLVFNPRVGCGPPSFSAMERA